MKKIKGLENSRWFIWTLVLSTLILVSLAGYIFISSENESSTLNFDAAIKLHSAQIQTPVEKTYPPVTKLEKQLNNTTWVPDSEYSDSSIHFFETKDNDPNHLNFDYQTAADTETQDIGYWTEKNGLIILVPTQIITYPSDINKALLKGKNLLVYTTDSAKYSKYVAYPN